MAILHYTNASECFIPEKLDFEPLFWWCLNTLKPQMFSLDDWETHNIYKDVHLISKTKDQKKKKEKVWTVRLFCLTLWSGVSGQTADVCGSDIIRTKRAFIKYVQLKFHPDIKLTVITPTTTTRAENILVTISSSATSCIHFPFWEAERKIPVFPS